MTLYDRLRIATAVVTWYLLNRHFLLRWVAEDISNVECSLLAFAISGFTAFPAGLAYMALYWVATGRLP